MKKNSFFVSSNVKKYCIGLKLCSTLLIISLLLSVNLKAEGQAKKKTLSLKNVSISEALKEIKKATGYSFIFNKKSIDESLLVNVNINKNDINSTMEQCLENTGLTYNIKNEIIVLVKKPKTFIKPQSIIVKGTVKDEKGQPLPGVTILIKGTQTGVSSDIDGHFKIDVTGTSKVLKISFMGMKSIEHIIKDPKKHINIVLEEEGVGLNEVVVTGYAQTTTRKATGSVAVVHKEEFENKAIPSVDLLLKGQVAGMQTTITSGRPGETAKIRIRGTNTLTGNAEPLWVVDGVPLQRDIPKFTNSELAGGDFESLFSNGVAGINPNDIESVAVLKDAAAAAIYGSRAASGVIVITTKKGKAGEKMNINYSANLSITQKPSRTPGLMNASEKIAWEKELWNEFSADKYKEHLKNYNPSDPSTRGYFPVIGIVGMVNSGYGKYANMSAQEKENYLNSLSNNSTDWLGQLFRNSISQSHYLSMSGGKDNYTYYLSMGLSNNNGLVKKTDYNRYNINAKINLKPTKKLKIGFIVDIAKQQSTGFISVVDPFQYAYFANPYEKPYDENGNYKPDETYQTLRVINGNNAGVYPKDGFNILREIDLNSQKGVNISTNIQSNLNYTFSDNFYFSGVAAYSYTTDNSESIVHQDTYTAFNDRLYFDTNKQIKYGSIMNNYTFNNSYNLRGQFNFNKDLNEDLTLNILAGSEIRGQSSEISYQKRYGYDPVTQNSSIPIMGGVENISINDMRKYADIVDKLSGKYEYDETFASFYGAFDINAFRKYSLSLTLRTDGSNNFGSDQQFNPTWSLGSAWHIDQEKFMENLSHIISSLSLKLSTGYTGNINKSISPRLIMNYEQGFRKTPTMNYRLGNINDAPNPNLRWEKTQDYKAGLNFGLFSNKISGTIEGYYRLSTDVVTNVSVVSTTGFASQAYNTSEIENKGLEVSLSSLLFKNKDLSVRASANLAWNSNKLKKYESTNSSYTASQNVGYPLNSYLAGKYLGIDPETGVYKFQLRPDAQINRVEDYNNSSNYVYYFGTSTPPINGGFSFSVNYKQFTFSLNGTYSLNRYMSELENLSIANSADKTGFNGGNNKLQSIYNDIYYSHTNVKKEITDRWTPSNPNAKYPRLIDQFGDKLFLDQTNPVNSVITKGALLQKVSYLKINSLSLGYSLPTKWTKKIGIESCSLNCSVNNILTLTNYDGIDPETPGATYPIARTTSFGINVNF